MDIAVLPTIPEKKDYWMMLLLLSNTTRCNHTVARVYVVRVKYKDAILTGKLIVKK